MKNYWQDKKVLVAGANGFIGSNMVAELIKRKARVTALVHKDNSSILKYKNKINIEKVNLTKLDECISVSSNLDLILNFAALDGGFLFKKKNSQTIFKNNVQISLNLLEAARICNVSKVLQMSSVETLSNANGGYVISKKIIETVSKLYRKEFKSNIYVVRSGNIYGYESNSKLEKDRIIPSIIKNALINKPIKILGDGKNEINLIYISDFINVVLDLIEAPAPRYPINIYGNNKISIKNLINLIMNESKSKSIIAYIKNNKIYKIKSKKIKNLTFKEKYSLEQGFKETIKQYKK